MEPADSSFSAEVSSLNFYDFHFGIRSLIAFRCLCEACSCAITVVYQDRWCPEKHSVIVALLLQEPVIVTALLTLH